MVRRSAGRPIGSVAASPRPARSAPRHGDHRRAAALRRLGLESSAMKNLRLGLWIFGPIGSGKSHVLSRLPLEDFERVDQDAELERLLRAAGLPLDTRTYDAAQSAEF